MKKYFTILALCVIAAAANGLDIFGVYKTNAPEGCSGVDITAHGLTLEDLTAVAICNNPALYKLRTKGALQCFCGFKLAYLRFRREGVFYQIKQSLFKQRKICL